MSIPPTIVKPLEVGLCVSDLAASQRFYGELLGLAPEREVSIGAEVGARTGVASGAFTISRYRAQCGTVVKLLQPADAAPRAGAVPSTICDRAATAFLTFVVDDLDDLVVRLRDAAVSIRTEPAIVAVREGMRLCFVADPDGFPVELVQYD